MDSTEENNGCLSASDSLAHMGSSTSGYPVEKLDDTDFYHRLGKVKEPPLANSLKKFFLIASLLLNYQPISRIFPQLTCARVSKRVIKIPILH